MKAIVIKHFVQVGFVCTLLYRGFHPMYQVCTYCNAYYAVHRLPIN
jgi:hypothetical protein